MDKEQVQRELVEYFRRNGLNVAVGLTKDGIALRSQDKRVDAVNIGEVRPYLGLAPADSNDHVTEYRGWVSKLERTALGTLVVAYVEPRALAPTARLEFETSGPPPAYLAQVRAHIEVDKLSRDLPFSEHRLT